MADEVYQKGIHLEVKATDDPDVLHMIGSTEAKDADGDIIRVKGWDLSRYRKNPVIMWAHNYALPPIGRAIKLLKNLDDLRLEFWIRFSQDEFAQRIKALYDEKIMRMSSVGFIAKERRHVEPEKGEEEVPEWARGWEFLNQQLLELSCVPIGSNPEALARAITKGAKADELTDLLSKSGGRTKRPPFILVDDKGSELITLEDDDEKQMPGCKLGTKCPMKPNMDSCPKGEDCPSGKGVVSPGVTDASVLRRLDDLEVALADLREEWRAIGDSLLEVGIQPKASEGSEHDPVITHILDMAKETANHDDHEIGTVLAGFKVKDLLPKGDT